MKSSEQKVQDAIVILNRIQMQMRPKKNIERMAGSIELEILSVKNILEEVKRNLAS